MEIDEVIKNLDKHNRWRRSEEDMEMMHPTLL